MGIRTAKKAKETANAHSYNSEGLEEEKEGKPVPPVSMFDGNYRSRRPVNLGSRGSKGRSQILANSKRQREDRRLQHMRLELSKRLQSRQRGNVARRQLAADLEQEFATPQLSFERYTLLLNTRLRLYFRTKSEQQDSEKVQHWLHLYAQLLNSVNQPTSPPPLMHCIVRATLELLPQNPSSPELARILSFALSLENPWSNLGFEDGYARAVQALWKVLDHEELARSLYVSLCRATPTHLPSAQAALAALGLLVGDTNLNIDALTGIFSSLAAAGGDSGASDEKRDVFTRVVNELVTQRAVMLIQRLLQLNLPTATVVGLLHVLWSRNKVLQVYTGAVVRGGPSGLEQFQAQQQAQPSTLMLQEEDDESSSDEDGEEEEERSRTTSRLSTKQEFSTLTKLDRLAATEYSNWRNRCLEESSSRNLLEEKALALQMGDPEVWVSWSRNVFASTAAADYVSWLGKMLHHATGLKARQSASSPFLTKLAFAQTNLVENLFEFCCRGDCPDKLTAWSVFCDILSQQLVAMKDDQFLQRYSARASDIVLRLKDMLYNLYWAQPVKTVDIQNMYTDASAMSRARLLLTGTKLWNLFYERWCRLVRQSSNFCDESAWWFPISEHQTNVVGVGDEDDMDVHDSDSDDQPMDDADALAGAFSDAKMARVLTYIPQSLPFERRVRLFQSLLANDKKQTQDESSDSRAALFHMMRGEEFDMAQSREKVNIHRDRLYSDSMEALNKLGPRLRRRVQVSFVNQHGAQEAGIDGGGVFKEFIDDLIKDAFLTSSTTTSSKRFFEVTPQETLAVNTALAKNTETLTHYEFLGRVLGKAVYESILVDPQFCLPFLNQLLGKQNSLEDLKNYDLEYYKNLIKLLDLSAEDVTNLGMTFELTLNNEDGSKRDVELIAGGRRTPVTKQNVIQYVHLVAYQRLNIETAAQTKAFLRGFRDLIPASWVRLFSAYELQKLVSGDDSVRGIDVASLKKAMQYASGYHPSQAIVQWFWDIVENDMSAEQQRKLLKFMTSCSRQPLLGFQSLEPAPCLQQIRIPNALRDTNDPDALAKETPLPTASTCMNLLKLPNYPSKQLMKWKLLAAIEAGAGFELT